MTKLCEVLARNVALEEVKEVRGLLAETRQQMQELRAKLSVGSAKVMKRKLDGKERKDRERLEGPQEVFVLGGSRIRNFDGTFCEANRERRMKCCLPGTGVQDVVERHRRVVEGTRKEALVVVHVGVNDVDRMRSEELVDRYKKLLREVKESGRRYIVSRMFPRQGVRVWWLSHALGLNERLMRMCGKNGVGFMDEWSRFYVRQELYARESLPFSRKGVQNLSECLERAVRQFSQRN